MLVQQVKQLSLPKIGPEDIPEDIPKFGAIITNSADAIWPKFNGFFFGT